MKVKYKINTLRGIFFCLQGNKFSPCHRTVFSQTQKTKNVWLKRRFKFVVEKTTNLKPLPFCLERVSRFLASLQTANTFPPALIFAREQKCIINHSGLGFCAGMVVTNTTKALEKFLINVFPLKDFLN